MKTALQRLCVLFCLLVPVTLLLGQQSTGQGTVSGQVTDQTGASVPGAVVTLTDVSTGIPITTQTNGSGQYVFNNVAPGTYNLEVTKTGFKKSEVTRQQVTASTNLTLNVSLEVGSATTTVEIKEVLGAELQTENATMGSSLGGEAILQLPTISRDVSALTFYQPTASPTFNGAEMNISSGTIAGNFADQNTFMLDGGNNTSDLDGDNATYVGHNGAGVMPTPAESVEEFRVNTNNMTPDFSTSGGGQVMVITKRGTNTFHGSAYDFFQGDWLNSNDWFNNSNAIPKPKGHFNRFGGALGGPLTPHILGGKTYFYVNYEGQRYPRSGPFEATVPANTLRNGIIQEYDAAGNIVQYNAKALDPRGIGIDPIVSEMWSKYMPACNSLSGGDHGLNTCGYIGTLNFPLSNDFGVVRLDHDFGDKWRFFSSYRYFRNDNPTTNQVDIGGLLPGDTLGQPATASTDIYQPRFFVVGLTGTLSPTLTNEFHASYTRNQWTWLRAGGVPQIAGFPGGIEIGGETSSALIPMNEDTQDARRRLWDGHDYDYRDSITKLAGTHLFQLGGEFLYENYRFDRYDNVVGGLTQLVYNISDADINMAPYVPASVPSAYISSFEGLFADVLGLTSASDVVVTRTGASLTANPIGTPVHSNVGDKTWSIFFNDTWKIKPNFTLTYGLNYQVQMPPTDAHGEQDILTDANGNVITAESYLAGRYDAAIAGQVYAPTIGFTPIGDVKGLSYPYKPFWGQVAPRVSIAWNPQTNGGFLGKLFGDKATVLRVGYGRFYTRNLGIDNVSTPVLGDGFLQPVSCTAPTTSGTCTATDVTTPLTAFRVGVDGVPPAGAIPSTLTTPVTPGVNAAYATLVAGLDNNFRPGASNSVDFSIQRQFKGNTVFEISYVGVYANHLFQGIDLDDVPWMMKLNGQTFAQAYDNLYNQLHGGTAPSAVTPQPFFQAALPANSAYCKGYANCTVAIASQETPNINGNFVTNLWSDLDSSFTFGPQLLSSTQCYFCYVDTSLGYSNYNALTVSLQKRTSNFTINGNFTYGHALGTLGLNQAYTLNNANNPWNLSTDYGPQFFDRKFTANVLASVTLPFGKGQRWASNHAAINEVIGGWIISPIFSYGSGLPVNVFTGSGQEWGNGEDGNGCDAVALNSGGYSNTPHYGVGGSNGIGINTQAVNGGYGANMFANPAAVYDSFAPNLVGMNESCGGGGNLRGMQRWNVDLGLTKDLPIFERVGIQFYAQAFNVFNHFMWGDPGGQGNGSTALSLQNAASFGILNSQYNALGLGGGGAAGEYTRIIQLGVRIRF